MGENHAVTLLHLSDLHFGPKHRFSEDGPDSLLARLSVDLGELRGTQGIEPELIVVSGDLGELGKKQEFEKALVFLQGLVSAAGLDARRVVIVPGNHDINWNKCRNYFNDCEEEGSQPEEPYFPKFVFFEEMFRRFYAGEAGFSFTKDEPWTLFEYPDLGVVVAGLNSVIAESHRAEDHYGFLGEKQLRAFAEKLRPYEDRGFLRVGVMHHHPQDRRGGERTREDQKLLHDLLAPHLNLLLHGDAHEENERSLRVNVAVFGIGSLGVDKTQRADDVPNGYQILTVHPGGVRRILRSYAPDKKSFLPRGGANVKVTFERVNTLGLASSTKPRTDVEQLVASYRRSIATETRVRTMVDLLQEEETGASATALDFLRVFVPQDVSREEPAQRMPPDADDVASKMPELYPAGLAEPVTKVLARGWVYMLGAPGAGKTALTRWIMLSLCVPDQRIEGFSEDLVPVQIDMRRFDEERQRASETFGFFEYLDRRAAERSLGLRKETLEELGRQGRLYFVFDGLDEVIELERRLDCAAMIASLAQSEAYGRCRGLVTSRIVGAEHARPSFEGSGFSTYTLRELTETQRDCLLDAWHDMAFSREPEVGAHRRERLQRAIEGSASLQKLCANPLCCSLVAFLNRGDELPEERHRVYQKILEKMADRWEAKKKLSGGGSARLGLDKKLSFLRKLAWWMMHEGGAGNSIEERELQRFAASFFEEPGVSRDAAMRMGEALIHDLQGRNEVLSWLGGSRYGFAHRAFLEWSAASEAIEKERNEAGSLGPWFRAHWKEEAWEEPLLLACGILGEMENGPARVVRVLQEIPVGEVGFGYRFPEEYTAFCIKALGELKSLERGVAREFADEINTLLEFRNLCDWDLRASVYLDAFRRCAGKWPGVERLIEATERLIEADKKSYRDQYPLWIAAAGRGGRLSVLLRALEFSRVKLGPHLHAPYPLCSEAAKLGRWSREELERVCDAAAIEELDHERFMILSCLVRTPGMSFVGTERPIRMLHELMQSSKDEDARQRAAWTLIKTNVHVDASLATLRSSLTGDKDFYRHWAACLLADVGHASEVLDIIAGGAVSDWRCLGRLLDLARVDATAAKALDEALPRIRQQTDLRIYLWAFVTAEHRKHSIISEEDMSLRLREQTPEDAQRFLNRLGFEPRLTSFVANEYIALLPRIQDLELFRMAASDALYLDPKHGGSAVWIVWRALLRSTDASTSVSAAWHILRKLPDVDSKNLARDRLVGYLEPGIPERNRLNAARALGIDEPAARRVLEELSRNATDEWTRFDAARPLGDHESIHQLAERAQNEKVRAQAREAQDLYAHTRALLRVGRPRRARVFLHGAFAGILEETAPNRGTRFSYDPEYLKNPKSRPLAPNLPLRAEPYVDDDKLHPFFANLLPEGPLFTQTARKLGLRSVDRFGMLLHVGGDVMGAVQVFPENEGAP